MEQKRKSKKELIRIIGLILIAMSSFYLIENHFQTDKFKQENEDKIQEFFVKEKIDDNTSMPDENKKENNDTFHYSYMAVLEIPSINLNRGLVDPNSKYNDLNYNVKIIEGSNMPDVENGNLILAGHNGTSYVSFFRDLDKLNINDKIYIYYDGYKYEYLLDDIYEVNKNGQVKIKRNNNKNTITLITCKKNSNNTQNVYIGYLSNKTKY